MSKINLVFCLDENYSEQLPSIIFTLLKSNKSELSFHFITTAPESAGIKRTKNALISLGHDCEIIPIEVTKFHGFLEMRHLKYSTYFKFLIPSLIKAERVLYIDTDVYINTDLSEIFNADLNGKAIGVVMDEYVNSPSFADILKDFVLKGGSYFNAGIILWDLTKIDREGFFDECLNAFSPNEYRIRFGDQCLLNVLMDEKKTLLPGKWNYQIAARNLDFGDLENRIKNSEGIFHFCASPKPWQCNPQDGVGAFWQKYVACNDIPV